MEEAVSCIVCGIPMSKILYGHPTETILDMAKEQDWILGGCMPSPISFYCKVCRVSWSEDLGFDQQA